MENIRCLIADIPQLLLADIVEKIIEERPGVEVMYRSDNENALHTQMREGLIDVVIHSMADHDMSLIIKELLKTSSHTISVGVIDDGRRVCICMRDIGPDEFIELIRLAAKNRKYYLHDELDI